jgi:hypothetical protein
VNEQIKVKILDVLIYSKQKIIKLPLSTWAANLQLSMLVKQRLNQDGKEI